MSEIETGLLIDVSLFNMCLIDGVLKEKIIKQYPSRKFGAYYLDKFSNHLLEIHGIKNIKEYCKEYLKIQWPLCPISREEVGYKINGKGILCSRFKRGKISKKMCPAFSLACDRFSRERKAEGNPMFGRKPWNKGLTIEHPSVARIAQARIGRSATEATKQKQSISAYKRLIHGHTGHKHSEKSKQLMRIQTAKGWSLGRFNRTTSIHLKMREFLKLLPLKEKPQEEYQIKYFSLDFAFPNAKVAIECQGTFFHVDPRIYPNGPINAIQRRNFGRDRVKRKVCSQEGWTIIEIWETEINSGQFKDILTCKLSELNLLNL